MRLCHCEERSDEAIRLPLPRIRTVRNGDVNPQCHCEPQSGEAIRPHSTPTNVPRGTELPQALYVTARNGDAAGPLCHRKERRHHKPSMSLRAAKRRSNPSPRTPHIHTRAETPKPFPPAFFTQTPCLSPPGPSPPTSPGYWGFFRWCGSPS